MIMKRLSLLLGVVVLLHSSATGQDIWPGQQWQATAPEQVGMNAEVLQKARDYALTGGGSGCVTRSGKLVMQWGDQQQRYDLKSTTK